MRHFFCLFFLITTVSYAQNLSNKRTVALLDLTQKNGETSDAELFSAKHILKTAGIPFIITTNVNTAKNYGFIIASSKIETTTFTLLEKDSLINYVNKGGVLIAPNVKDSYFNSLFGISSNLNSNTRYTIKFNTFLNDPSFKWLNDTLEQTISLGRTTYTSVINTRSYSTSGAVALANFDDNSTAITKKIIILGYLMRLDFHLKT